MTQEQLEGQEIVATFMGWEKQPWGSYNPPARRDRDIIVFDAYNYYEMKWNSSWDWLMLAWDKLRRAVFEENDCFYPHPFDAMTDVWGLKCTLAEKDAAFDILVQSIKWYNTTKTTNTP